MIRVLYILMGVEILFGCAYVVTNFGAPQQFRENLDSFLPTGAVSLIQLVFAAAALWYVTGKLGFGKDRYRRAYVCAFLLTVPFLLQMHMARLTWSFSFSLFLWLFGLLTEVIKSGLSGRRTMALCGAYFLYGVVCPDGLWLGGMLLLAGMIFSGRRKRRGRRAGESAAEREPEKGEQKGPGLRFGLAAVFTAVLLCLVNGGLNERFPEQRRIYRENNFGTTVASRFVWPYFGKTYYFWNEDVKAVLPPEEAEWLDKREDLVGEEFYPLLVETYGKEKAVKLCVRMGRSCLEVRTKEVLGEIGRDFKDYLLLPFTIENNLRGEGTSLTGWNYGRMKEHTPVLVKYYYRYGIFVLPVLLLVSVLLWCMERGGRSGRFLREKSSGERTEGSSPGRRTEKGIPTEWKFALFTLLLYAFWYTMRSNIPVDYKFGLPILFFWYLASVSGLLCGEMKRD